MFVPSTKTSIPAISIASFSFLKSDKVHSFKYLSVPTIVIFTSSLTVAGLLTVPDNVHTGLTKSTTIGSSVWSTAAVIVLSRCVFSFVSFTVPVGNIKSTVPLVVKLFNPVATNWYVAPTVFDTPFTVSVLYDFLCIS